MKAGRKRKPGSRYASGDRMKTVRQDEVRRVALEARMRVFGVGLELAGRDVMGSPLGRLLHWKIITPAQADAGYDFALTMRDYLAASEGQRPSQGKASFLTSMRGTTGPEAPVRAKPVPAAVWRRCATSTVSIRRRRRRRVSSGTCAFPRMTACVTGNSASCAPASTP